MDLLHQWIIAAFLVTIDYVVVVCVKNSSQAIVYVMWDAAAESFAGPTYAGIGSGGEAQATAADIAAAHAEQAAAAAAAGGAGEAEDPCASLDGDLDEFRASLTASGVLQ